MPFLKTFYDARTKALGEQEFLKQVGHTEGGQPISAEQYHQMTGQLRDLLDPCRDDALLDLCCGNGLITADLAVGTDLAVGVELSGNLVDIARKYHGTDRIRYFQADVFALADLPDLEQTRFSKVLMHGALQHFRPAQFDQLLRTILSVTTPDPVIVFGFVPEHGKQRAFYNTPRRKFESMIRRALGRDAFGFWWRQSHIAKVCQRHGLACTFHSVGDSLYASTHRFNVRVFRPETGQKTESVKGLSSQSDGA